MKSLDETLQLVRSGPIILTSQALPWSPGVELPRSTRSGLRQHRKMLHKLIEHSDVRVCASPTWHRGEWRYAGQQRYVCAICERLAPWIERAA